MPTPSMSLRSGPPKHAETAICGEMARAVATLATRSPTLLPMAITVKPRTDVEMPKIRPRAWMMATSSADMTSSQTMVDANPTTTRQACSRGCGGAARVASQTAADATAPHPTASTQTLTPWTFASRPLKPFESLFESDHGASRRTSKVAQGGAATANFRRLSSQPSSGVPGIDKCLRSENGYSNTNCAFASAAAAPLPPETRPQSRPAMATGGLKSSGRPASENSSKASSSSLA
mmetsp:Transcript_1312/g.4867  ORF Transcript_1312/g.4867 Transcript_1312/m.4867 type:complete len:235 (+) Transcript_1312:337-1041(+)